MLIRARGRSGRLLSPLTSPTLKLQSEVGAGKEQRQENAAGNNPSFTRDWDGEVYPVLPPLFQMESDSRWASHSLALSPSPTLTQLSAELEDVPLQRVAPHSFSFRA